MVDTLVGRVLLIEAELIDGLLLVRGRNEGTGIERYPVCVYGKNIDSKTIKEIRGFPVDTNKLIHEKDKELRDKQKAIDLLLLHIKELEIKNIRYKKVKE
jgi:hypothetical protein